MNRKFLHGILLVLLFVSTSQAVRVGFTESDYAAVEGGDLRVIIQTRDFAPSDGDVTVRVSALTKAQFLELPEESRDQCGLDFAPESFDFAEESDFNFTTQDITLTGNGDREFIIALIDDIAQENDEIFIVFLEVIGNPPGVTVERTCAEARIRIDSDAISLQVLLIGNISADEITVREDAGILNNKLTVRKVGETELEITVLVQPQSSGQFRALNGSDFILRTSQFVLQPSDTEVTIPIEIIDDNIPEETEEVGFRISILGTSTAVTTRLVIRDNDVVTVGFLNDISLTVEEGSSVVLCVGVITPTDVAISRLLFLTIESMDGTALAGEHYTSAIFFIETRTVECRTVEILDDEQRTPSRAFTVTLAKDDFDIDENLIVLPESNTVTITITDNDNAIPNAPSIELEVDDDDDKNLTIKWTQEITQFQPVDTFRITITETRIRDEDGEDDNGDTENPDNGDTEQEDTVITTVIVNGTETSYIFPDTDPETIYTVTVCARNDVGENCSTPETYEPLTPDPDVGPSPLSPGIIAVIVVIAVFVVLLCCLCCLILCICCWRERENEKNYYPEKNEKKYREKHDEYRGESDNDSEESV